MSGFGVEVDGLAEAIAGLERAAERLDKTATDSIEPGAARMVSAARAATPRDTGALADSIHLERHGDTVEVSAGGPGVDYAAPVHEDLTARHATGSAKFLERPVLAEARRTGDDVEAGVDAMLGREL